MPSFSPKLRRRLHFAAFLAIVFIAYGAAAQAPPPVVNGPPIPAGQGRVWFYRVFFPEDTGGMPPISMNGQLVGYARAGWSFYRDMPAGAYHVSVESYLPGSGWSKDIVLLPGTQVALAINSDPTYISNLSGFRRGTYDVVAEPGGAAYLHIMQTQFGT
ncbi:MAG TPA: hypothetical protein VN808_05735, partial [Stellaceae bacterium]|nr:hypothetical protein [Stellaceae bacterium]